MKKVLVFLGLSTVLFLTLTLLLVAVLERLDGPSQDSFKELEKIEVAKPALTLPVVVTTKKIRLISLKAAQVLRLQGEVGQNIEGLISQLSKANEDKTVKEIYLLIDSPGGSVFHGAKFISAIESSKKPVITVCEGLCASMAALIHQYGSKRLSTDRSILMFHDAAGGLQGPIGQMQSRLSFITRMTTKMDAYVAKRAGIPLDKFMADSHVEIWIDGEDALDQHFSDELVSITIVDEQPVSEQFFFPSQERSEQFYFGDVF